MRGVESVAFPPCKSVKLFRVRVQERPSENGRINDLIAPREAVSARYRLVSYANHYSNLAVIRLLLRTRPLTKLQSILPTGKRTGALRR